MSGQQIGSVVGGVIGAYFGGPYGYAIGSAIGGAIGGYVDPTVIKGPRLTDATQQTANDGVPIPWGFGTFPTSGNIIWTSELFERKKEDDGKGTGIVNVTYHYYRSYAVGICQGVRQTDGTYLPIAGILQVKENGKIVYDAQPGVDSEQMAQNTKFLRNVTFFLGSEDQDPFATAELYDGAGNVPAFPGTVYMGITNKELTDSGGAIPQYEFVVSVCGDSIPPEVPQLELLESGLPSSATCVEWSSNSQYVAAGGYLDADTSAYLWIYKIVGGVTQAVAVDVQPLDRVQAMDWRGSSLLVASDAHELLVYEVSGLFATLAESITIPELLSVGQFRGCAWNGSYIYASVAVGGAGILGRWDSDTFGYIEGGDISLPEMPKAFQGVSRINDTQIVVALDSAPGLVIVDGSGTVEPIGIDVLEASCPKISRFGEIAAMRADAPYWRIVSNPLVDDASNSAVGLSWSPDGYYIAVGARVFQQSASGYELFQDLAPFQTSGSCSFSPDGKYLAVSIGDEIQIWSGFELVGAYPIPDAPGFWIRPDGSIVGPPTATLDRCKPYLFDIVAEVCERSGLGPDDYDVSQLVDQVDGFKVATETTAEAIIAPLMAGFFFDAAEYDDKIRFVKRGGDVVGELNVDDLCESDGDVIEETELQEVELLRKVHVRTVDPAAGFIPTTQTAERRTSTVAAKGEQTTEIPVVTDKDTQAQIADKKLKVAWSETRRFKTCIPYTLPQYVPTDVIGLTDAKGRRSRVRLMEMAEDSGRIRIDEAMLDRQSSYTSDVEGVVKRPPSVTSGGLIGPTFGVAMNLPRLRSGDIGPGAYLAASGYLRGWGGAAVLLSVDDGVSYQQVTSFVDPSSMGVLAEAITESSEPISVFMRAGTLSSITAEQVSLRQNAFAITTSGVSELGQFQTAVQDSSGVYELTNTVRGGLGTTAAAHAENDPFVMLASAQFLPLDISLAGRTLYFKFVSFGTSPDDAEAVPFMFNPSFFGAPLIEPYTDESYENYVDELGEIYYSET